jgi:carbon monoxide dehydrogenase subunit G
MSDLVAQVDVDATQQQIWDAVVEWERQSDWIPLTRVRRTAQGGVGVGGGIEGWTGIGPVGFRDPMTITAWSPPVHCAVRHNGRLVRGTAAFEVESLPGGRARLTWSEQIVPPFGRAGAFGWRLATPVTRWVLRRALRKFARQVHQGSRP